jgi:hypothetical protein
MGSGVLVVGARVWSGLVWFLLYPSLRLRPIVRDCLMGCVRDGWMDGWMSGWDATR